MSAITDYFRNKLVDFLYRGQSFVPPATWYIGLLTCTKNSLLRSTTYALNDTVPVLATDGTYHLYKVTTGGATAGSAPTYPGVKGEVITDGAAVLTEQSAALQAGTAAIEVTGGSYARVGVASSLANWAGTQGAGTTTVSSGNTGKISNNAAVTFPAPSAAWMPAGGAVWASAQYDAASGGNLCGFAPLDATKNINATDPAPSFAVSVLSIQFDK